MATKDHESERTQQWLSAKDELALRPARRPPNAWDLSICAHCGNTGKPRNTRGGSLLVEIALWIFLIVPGIIYSLWRIGTKRPACRACGAIGSMVPLYSPRGRALAAEFGTDTAPATTARD